MSRHVPTFYGVFLVAVFALVATALSQIEFFKSIGISSLILAIVLGMVYANTLKRYMPHDWQRGINFCTKYVLRFGIVLYGFRLTFQNLQEVGFGGVSVAGIVVGATFIFGYVVGVKLLKMDKELAILCSAGASICGAAAVLATSSVVKNESYKSAVAVSFVVIFGTIGMFLLPFLYKVGVLDFSESQMGAYIGAVLHEVAHVVGSSDALGDEVAKNAIIVKMIRVIFLVPFLILLSLWLVKSGFSHKGEKSKVMIPWFAVLFLVVVGFNSLELLSYQTLQTINEIDIFALTMAMGALGMETSFDKFKSTGVKPLYLNIILFAWLLVVGFVLVKVLM